MSNNDEQNYPLMAKLALSEARKGLAQLEDDLQRSKSWVRDLEAWIKANNPPKKEVKVPDSAASAGITPLFSTLPYRKSAY